MPRGRLGAEQIVTKLRQMEVMQGQGKSIASACKEARITEQSYYRYRKEYGGLNVDQARRLKQLESENNRLKSWLLICRWRNRYSRTSHREICEPRATPVDGRGGPTEIWAERATSLPDCRATAGNTAIRSYAQAR
jgi:putative transposase